MSQIFRTVVLFIPICIILLLFIPTNTSLIVAQSTEKSSLIPKIQRETLLNGLSILSTSTPGTDSVSVVLMVKSGATFDLINKAGLANLTAQILCTKPDLSEHNISVNALVNWDTSYFQITGSANNINDYINILGSLITTPTFTENNFTSAKQKTTEQLSQQNYCAENVERLFIQTLFGTHPYNHLLKGTNQSVNNISRLDVINFYKRHYIANNSALIIVGDINFSQILPNIRRSFGGWIKAKVPSYTFLSNQKNKDTKIIFHQNPKQHDICIQLGSRSGNVTLSNIVSWGITTKLLNGKLSDCKVSADLRYLSDSPWIILLTINEKDLIIKLDQITKLVKTINKESFSDKEIQIAKEAFLQEYKLPFTKDSSEIARILSYLERYHISLDNYSTIPSQVANFNISSLQPVFEQINREPIVISIYGGIENLSKDLSKFGIVEIFSTTN